MEVLKVYSLRLESKSIDKADEIARSFGHLTRSDVIRVAIWVGEKIISSRNVFDICKLQWAEEFRNKQITLEDVLRTACIELENLKSLE